MIILVIALIAGVLPLIPAIVLAIKSRRQAPAQASRKLILGIGSFNVVVALMIVSLGLVWLINPGAVAAAGLAQEEAVSSDPYRPFAAALAVSVGCISAAYAVSTTGSAAVGAIAEKPKVAAQALIFVGLAEGVALWGFIIAFFIIRS